MHVVYQAACSAYSLHQSLALDWSWLQVGHPGRLTRIVCGCATKKDEERMRTTPLEGDERFSVFFSRDWNAYVPLTYPEAAGDTYHAYNHPFGIADWLVRASPVEDYIVYMEPDMVFNRPILHHVVGNSQLPQVARGQPVGQWYHYVHVQCPEPCENADPGWMEFAKPEVCGDACPDPSSVDNAVNDRHYALGPPTMMHRDDWARLAPVWCNYSVAIRSGGRMKSDGAGWLKKGDRVYIAEMLAYSLAAAVLQLPHAVVRDLATDAQDQCNYNPGNPPDNPQCKAPRILHYCYPQNVKSPVGHWIWNKYRMPMGYREKDDDQWQAPHFWDCETPLLEELPDAYMAVPGWAADHQRHVVWMIDVITKSYNQATLMVKQNRCKGRRVEDRKLLRVTEEFSYVPAEKLTDPGSLALLAPNVRSWVKKDVLPEDWRR